MSDEPTPLLIYDGDCSFCTANASWIASHLAARAQVVAWQQLGAARLAELGLTSDDVQQAAWWIDESGERFRGHLAIGHALAATHGWRRVCGRLLLIRPFRWAAGGVYPLLARWRHLLPGGTPACRS